MGEWPSGKGNRGDFAVLLSQLFHTESPLLLPQAIDSPAFRLKGDPANSERNECPGHISNCYLGNMSIRPFWAVCRIIVSIAAMSAVTAFDHVPGTGELREMFGIGVLVFRHTACTGCLRVKRLSVVPSPGRFDFRFAKRQLR